MPFSGFIAYAAVYFIFSHYRILLFFFFFFLMKASRRKFLNSIHIPNLSESHHSFSVNLDIWPHLYRKFSLKNSWTGYGWWSWETLNSNCWPLNVIVFAKLMPFRWCVDVKIGLHGKELDRFLQKNTWSSYLCGGREKLCAFILALRLKHIDGIQIHGAIIRRVIPYNLEQKSYSRVFWLERYDFEVEYLDNFTLERHITSLIQELREKGL